MLHNSFLLPILVYQISWNFEIFYKECLIKFIENSSNLSQEEIAKRAVNELIAYKTVTSHVS
jgi:hypothetical protein